MENPGSMTPNYANNKVSASQLKKWIFFAIGFVGWYLVNGLFWLLFGGQLGFGGFNNEYIILNILAWPVNLIATIILATMRKTRMIGLGLISALALNLLISLISGIASNGLCFIPFFIK